jgi:hypothetical protein
MMAEPSTEMPSTSVGPLPVQKIAAPPDPTKCVACERVFRLGDYVCLPNEPPQLLFCRTCFSKDRVPGKVFLYQGGKASSVGRARLLKNKTRLERMAKKQAKGKKR